MVTFRRSPSGKAVDQEYHDFRREARQNSMSIGEYGPQEINRFDLETAKITGRDNKRTYEYDPTIDLLGVSGRIVQDTPRFE